MAAKKTKPNTPTKASLTLDTDEIEMGIRRCEKLKAHMKGRRKLHMELNIRALSSIKRSVEATIEAAAMEHAVHADGHPVPTFLPLKDSDIKRLDFTRFAGTYKEDADYASGQIVVFAAAFYEKEDTGGSQPPDGWAHIGDQGNGYIMKDYIAWNKDVKEIRSEKHDVDLCTIPASLYDAHPEIDDVWLEITEFD